MSDGMGREFTYLSSHATNRFFIPNWGKVVHSTKAKETSAKKDEEKMLNRKESRNDTESKSGKATNAEHEHKVHRNK